MNPTKKVIIYYLAGLFFFEALVLIYVFSFDRQDQMQYINSFHSPLGDIFFKIVSSGVEIIIPILFLGYLIWKKKAWIKSYIISYVFSTLIVQFLKLVVFKEAMRPLAYFKGQIQSWHIVQNLLISEYNSMPSGHTSVAWFMCFWMSVGFNSRPITLFLILYAMLVAYSRVYLFQHFPIDTAVGAFIGTGISFLVYYFKLSKSDLNDSIFKA
jgi:membrane-associated phospholipid phosphatase